MITVAKKQDNYELVSPFIKILQARIKDPDLLKIAIDKIGDNKEIEVSDKKIIVYRKKHPIYYVEVGENEIVLIDYLVSIKYHFYFEGDITHIFINHEGLKEYLLFEENKLVERRLRGDYRLGNYYRIEHYDGNDVYDCQLRKGDEYITEYYQVNIEEIADIYNVYALGYVFVNKQYFDYDTYKLKINKGELL